MGKFFRKRYITEPTEQEYIHTEIKNKPHEIITHDKMGLSNKNLNKPAPNYNVGSDFRFEDAKVIEIKKNYNSTDLYFNKKICLLGSGSSLYEHDIKFENYDLVIGCNQIYKSDLINKINVLYHGISIHDVNFLNAIPTIIDTIKIVLVPRNIPSRIEVLDEIIKQYDILYDKELQYKVSKMVRDNPLTGLMALIDIINGGAQSIDIYGFDFYSKPYIDGPTELPNYPKIKKKSHDLDKNKKFFLNLLNSKKNIIWWGQN